MEEQRTQQVGPPARVPEQWRWTRTRARAAQIAAEGRMRPGEAAAALGIGLRQWERWRLRPEFRERVERLVREREESLRDLAIARRSERVAALQDRWLGMQTVLSERAQDPAMQAVPGGRTGQVVRQRKRLGTGASAETVDEYRVDTALLAELRATEEQAARELGQWMEEERQDSAPVVLTQVLVTTRSEAREYLERSRGLLQAPPQALASPTLAQEVVDSASPPNGGISPEEGAWTGEGI